MLFYQSKRRFGIEPPHGHDSASTPQRKDGCAERRVVVKRSRNEGRLTCRNVDELRALGEACRTSVHDDLGAARAAATGAGFPGLCDRGRHA
jgi:hypothetical protein